MSRTRKSFTSSSLVSSSHTLATGDSFKSLTSLESRFFSTRGGQAGKLRTPGRSERKEVQATYDLELDSLALKLNGPNFLPDEKGRTGRGRMSEAGAKQQGFFKPRDLWGVDTRTPRHPRTSTLGEISLCSEEKAERPNRGSRAVQRSQSFVYGPARALRLG